MVVLPAVPVTENTGTRVVTPDLELGNRGRLLYVDLGGGQVVEKLLEFREVTALPLLDDEREISQPGLF